MTTIIEALKTSHETQRTLCDQLDNAEEKSKKQEIFEALEIELKAHAAGEERAFYIPMMERDKGLDPSRHAIAEHHEMDEMMHKLNELDVGNHEWNKVANELTHKVRHHLKEEEEEFFPKGKEILTEEEVKTLGADYFDEEKAFKEKHGK